MKIIPETGLPKTGRKWVDLVSFVLKVSIVLVFLAVLVWRQILSKYSRMPAAVVGDMESILICIIIGYIATSAFFFVSGVIESLRQKYMQAVGNFVYAGLALLLVVMVLWPMTQPLK